MSTFPRCARALTADHLRASFVGVAVGLVFLGALSGWFLGNQVALYTRSLSAQPLSQGTGQQSSAVAVAQTNRTSSTAIVSAYFAPEFLGQIHAGQAARVERYNPSALLNSSVPALVTAVAPEVQAQGVYVEVAIVSSTPLVVQQADPNLVVSIERERVTPAALMLQAIGYRASQ